MESVVAVIHRSYDGFVDRGGAIYHAVDHILVQEVWMNGERCEAGSKTTEGTSWKTLPPQVIVMSLLMATLSGGYKGARQLAIVLHVFHRFRQWCTNLEMCRR